MSTMRTILLGPQRFIDDGRRRRAPPRRRRAASRRSPPAGRSASPTTPSSTGRPRRPRRQPAPATAGCSTCSTRTGTSPRRRSRSATGIDDLPRLLRLRLQHAHGRRATRCARRTSAARRESRSPRTTRSRRCGDVDRWYVGAARRRSTAEPTRRGAVTRAAALGLAPRRGRPRCSAECAGLVIAGGHVGTLLRTLRFFAIRSAAELPVVAWSAGAMALTDRWCCSTTSPAGRTAAEVLGPRARPGARASSPCRTPGAGCGSTTASGCRSWPGASPSTALPAPRRRRRRRASPTARPTCLPGARRHRLARRVTCPWRGAAMSAMRTPGHQPAARAAAASTGRRSTGSSSATAARSSRASGPPSSAAATPTR